MLTTLTAAESKLSKTVAKKQSFHRKYILTLLYTWQTKKAVLAWDKFI